MSSKKKVSNADFIAATRAVNAACSAMSLNRGKGFILMAMNYQVGGGVPKSVKPFDMIANGMMIGDVSDCVVGNFVADWLRFLNLFEKDDGHDDLFVAFLMMCGMALNWGICDFSQGAFVGVYGSFRVALGKCFLSKIARIGGRKSHDEIIKTLALGVSNSQRMAEVARVLSKGEKTRDDYIKLQYVEFRRYYMACIDDGIEKPVILGKGGVMYSVWTKSKIDGVTIPKDGGMLAEDWEKQSALYSKWIRNLQRDGVYRGRKNKPGAGGARVRARLRRTA